MITYITFYISLRLYNIPIFLNIHFSTCYKNILYNEYDFFIHIRMYYFMFFFKNGKYYMMLINYIIVSSLSMGGHIKSINYFCSSVHMMSETEHSQWNNYKICHYVT